MPEKNLVNLLGPREPRRLALGRRSGALSGGAARNVSSEEGRINVNDEQG